MITRALSILLVVLTAFFAQMATAALDVRPAMSCCTDASSHKTCPKCPANDAQKCCSTALPVSAVVMLPATVGLVRPITVKSFAISSVSYAARSDRPLLPPPKFA